MHETNPYEPLSEKTSSGERPNDSYLSFISFGLSMTSFVFLLLANVPYFALGAFLSIPGLGLAIAARRKCPSVLNSSSIVVATIVCLYLPTILSVILSSV